MLQDVSGSLELPVHKLLVGERSDPFPLLAEVRMPVGVLLSKSNKPVPASAGAPAKSSPIWNCASYPRLSLFRDLGSVRAGWLELVI